MAKIKSKEALLYDARLGKSGVVTMKVVSSTYDTNTQNFSANIQECGIDEATDAEGTGGVERQIHYSYVTITKEEMAEAEGKVVEDLKGKTVGEKTEIFILVALLPKISEEKLYGSSETFWEFVV